MVTLLPLSGYAACSHRIKVMCTWLLSTEWAFLKKQKKNHRRSLPSLQPPRLFFSLAVLCAAFSFNHSPRTGFSTAAPATFPMKQFSAQLAVYVDYLLGILDRCHVGLCFMYLGYHIRYFVFRTTPFGMYTKGNEDDVDLVDKGMGSTPLVRKFLRSLCS